MKFPPECNTKAGAYDLAAKIRAYWSARGKYPSVYVEQDNRNTSDVMWHVRSNMVGGRPHG